MQIISASINVELIDKTKLIKGKKGTYYNFDIIINDGPNEYGNDTTDHPAVFSEKLAADHIYTWSNENDIVYDCFMGSGTTAKMAHLQKRRWIGSEISQEYVAISNKRIQPYLDQLTMF